MITTTPAVAEPGEVAGRNRIDPRWLANLSVLTVPALVLAVMGYRYRWLADDGDIAMRTVRQILAGNGPVFNIGERVEVNTSALWTWLVAAIAFVTRQSVYTVALTASLVLAPAGLLFAADGTRRLSGTRARWLVPAGALVVAVMPPFWEFCTSGLESPLVFCWLGLSWWLLVRLEPGRLACAAAFVWGLGWVVRPELVVVTGFFLTAGWLVLRPRGRQAVTLAAAALTVPGGYQVFRMGYYAAIVPNTAIDKSAGSLVLGRGWAYLVNYCAPYLLWIPVLLLVALAAVTLTEMAPRRDDLVKIAAALGAGLVLAGYVVAVGGDFMHSRMLLPPTFLLLLLPVMVLPVPRPAASRRRSLAFAVLMACTAGWGLGCAAFLRLPDPGRVDANGVGDERSVWVQQTGDPHPVSAAPFLYGRRGLLGSAAHPSAFAATIRTTIASGVPGFIYRVNKHLQLIAPIRYDTAVTVAVDGRLLGRLGAAIPLDGLVIDIKGLSYPLASHLLIRTHGRAGHEKTITLPWELADYTPPGYHAGASAAQVTAARAALHCGELAQLQAAVREPLTWDQFWSNVLHAYSYTRLLIPPNPIQAEHEFCR